MISYNELALVYRDLIVPLMVHGKEAIDHVPYSTTACQGYKCRQKNCISCFEDPEIFHTETLEKTLEDLDDWFRAKLNSWYPV